jgi:PhnB protein
MRDFPDNSMEVAEEHLDSIAHIALPLGPNAMLMGTDVVGSMADGFVAGNNFYITIEPDTIEEAEQLFEGLSRGGQVQMPLQQTEWAERHGSLTDRFGVQWMLDYTGSVHFGGSD